MELPLILGLAVAFACALLAVVTQWFRAFYKTPIQASIRAFIGLLAMLVAALGVPAIDGKAAFAIDWGTAFVVQNGELRFSTGTSAFDHIIAWICIGVLLAICLIRVPIRPSVQ